jgi:hypothetical protein
VSPPTIQIVTLPVTSHRLPTRPYPSRQVQPSPTRRALSQQIQPSPTSPAGPDARRYGPTLIRHFDPVPCLVLDRPRSLQTRSDSPQLTRPAPDSPRRHLPCPTCRHRAGLPTTGPALPLPVEPCRVVANRALSDKPSPASPLPGCFDKPYHAHPCPSPTIQAEVESPRLEPDYPSRCPVRSRHPTSDIPLRSMSQHAGPTHADEALTLTGVYITKRPPVPWEASSVGVVRPREGGAGRRSGWWCAGSRHPSPSACPESGSCARKR